MENEYQIGGVADVLNKSSSKKQKKSKKKSLFEGIPASVKPVYKPFELPVRKVEPIKEKIVVQAKNTGEDKTKTPEKSEGDKPKSKARDRRTEEIVQKRKERKMLKKSNKNISSGKTTKPIKPDTESLKVKKNKRKLDELNGDSDVELDGEDDDNSDEEDDVQPQKKFKTSHKAGNDPEAEERTVFVGNLPINVKRLELKKLFSSVGQVESVRLRSAAIAKPDISKRVSVLRKEFHPERHSINGFVVFNTNELATKALEMNGTLFEGHHIRVDHTGNDKEPDHKHSVFVGNLILSIEEEDLWNLFEECGKITAVRVIRDKETGVGKGFGYVTFQDKDSVELALKLANHELKGRKIRVSRSMKRKSKAVRKNQVAIDKQSKKKNKGKMNSFNNGDKKFQGVTSQKGLKMKLAKKNKAGVKMPTSKKNKAKKN